MPLVSICLALLAPVPAPTVLARKFKANETLAYKIHSHLTSQQRQANLTTWIPADLDLDYGFSFNVQQLTNDGFAVVKYLRPTMTETQGETFDSPPKARVEKTNQVVLLTVSPVNELTDMKDVTSRPTKKSPARGKTLLRWAGTPKAPLQQSLLGQYVGELQRLALFVGPVDSALDFAPKLPLEPVAVGDTWKRTVGYQPQKLKGKDGKAAVQRLDYTYTYLGPMSSNGRQVLRIQAKLNLDSDLMDYAKSITNGQDEGIAKIPLKLDATIDFDLDPNTRDTLLAVAKSTGGFGVFLKGQDDATVEQKFDGQTRLELVGRKVVPTKAK